MTFLTKGKHLTNSCSFNSIFRTCNRVIHSVTKYALFFLSPLRPQGEFPTTQLGMLLLMFLFCSNEYIITLLIDKKEKGKKQANSQPRDNKGKVKQ